VDLHHYSTFSDGVKGGNPLFAQIWLRRLTWCKFCINILAICCCFAAVGAQVHCKGRFFVKSAHTTREIDTQSGHVFADVVAGRGQCGLSFPAGR